MNEEIFDLRLKGYCCSQIIMAMGLKRLGKENEDMLNAILALCGGVQHGEVCGILSAAMCLVQLANSDGFAKGMGDDLWDWFEDAYGTVSCEELLADGPECKLEKCPLMMENTFKKVEELLEWD